MSEHENNHNLVRLHEKWMNTTDKRLEKMEGRLWQVPWVLLIAAMNLCATLIVIILKR